MVTSLYKPTYTIFLLLYKPYLGWAFLKISGLGSLVGPLGVIFPEIC